MQLQSEILDDLDKLLDVEPTEQKNQLPNQDAQSPGVGSSENRASDNGPPNQEATKTDLTDSTETFLKRAWGRLPARARKHMPSSQSESFVPGFEKATERYYRKLADSE